VRNIAVALMAIGVLLAAAGVAGMLATERDGPVATPATPTTPATATPTTANRPTTSTTTVEAAVRAFVPRLVEAIRAGDNDFKFARLHPLVLARYGPSCRDGLSAAQPSFAMDVVSVGAPEPWAWETDGLSTTVEATPVMVKRSGADGALVDGVIHLAEAEGEIRWFTDCGTPASS
jgi:hypothetical protein